MRFFARRFTLPLLLAAPSLALAIPASVGPHVVFHSNGVAHREVCEGAPQPGHARCHAHVVTDERGEAIEVTRSAIEAARAIANARDPQAEADLTVEPYVIQPHGYGPADLAAAYNVPPLAGTSASVIAIIDAYGYTHAEADLGVYRAQYGLPPCTSANGCFTKYNQAGQTGSYPAQNIGWAQETALDLQMASALCPGCRIILVEASSASYNDLGAAVDTAASLGATVVSNSYGGGESGTQPFEPSYNHPGVAITVSSGDAGYGVQFPASSPHVIAVGGTSLHTSISVPRGWTETAWAHAGSGCSAIYSKPSWQTDPNCPRRMEADVSAVADPSTGVAVFAPNSRGQSVWLVFGGTSVAAPLIAAIYGANGGAVTDGSAYRNIGALNDVVTGTNGTCGITYYCKAGTGYDGPTGLGTPIGSTAF
jgi:subtilase family serine protease